MLRMGMIVAVVVAGLSGQALAGEDEDKAALKALDQAYADLWKAGDEEALMALFTDDVSVVPHHGDAPILGKDALRAFWFPPNSPPTIVPRFDHEPAEILVEGDVGIVRGRFNLTWEYDGTRTIMPEGNYIQIFKRTPEGWKIRLFTWNDDPRKVVQEPVSPPSPEDK